MFVEWVSQKSARYAKYHTQWYTIKYIIHRTISPKSVHYAVYHMQWYKMTCNIHIQWRSQNQRAAQVLERVQIVRFDSVWFHTLWNHYAADFVRRLLYIMIFMMYGSTHCNTLCNTLKTAIYHDIHDMWQHTLQHPLQHSEDCHISWYSWYMTAHTATPSATLWRLPYIMIECCRGCRSVCWELASSYSTVWFSIVSST